MNKTNHIILIILIVLIAFITIGDILLWVNAYVDGKYIIEPLFNNEAIINAYYMRIESLSIAMFLNLAIIIGVVFLYFHRRKK